MRPVQLPTRVDPGNEPSYLEPTPRPLRYLAQSFDAGVHSPTTTQRVEEERDELSLQANEMCCASVNWLSYSQLFEKQVMTWKRIQDVRRQRTSGKYGYQE